MARTMSFASLKVDGVNRARAVHDYAAGKSTNVARVLHTLGEKVLATGFLGGPRGEAFRSDLDQVGISHDFVSVDSPTRLCVTVVDESAGTATELIEESGPVHDREIAALHSKLRTLAGHADLFVFSGAVPAGSKPDIYARCIQPGSRVILDIVGDPLLESLACKPFVIKPNQSEIARTLRVELDCVEKLKDAMKQLVSYGAQWVVVTRGTQSTLITDGRSFWEVTTPKVKVISAIGSGDSFAAGLAAGLKRGQDVPTACILAAACGSANAMTLHAGHIRVDDVEALSKQVSLSAFA